MALPIGGGGGIGAYSVSGQVTDESGSGIAGISIAFSGGFNGTATTDANGHWSMSGLSGTVTVTLVSSEWTFSPPSAEITGPVDPLTFTAFPAVANDAYESDNTLAEAQPLALATPQNHTFGQPDDVDWISLDVVAGTWYVIETFNLAPELDTYLELYDAAGNSLATGDDVSASTRSRIDWQAPATGTYYVEITEYDGEGGAGSAYAYSVQAYVNTASPDVYEPDDAAAQAVGILTDGTVQDHTFGVSGDVDWVSFTTQQGTTYQIDTFDLSVDTDTVMELIDTDGVTQLDKNDDADQDTYGSSITWNAPLSGTYYIRVEEYNGFGGPGMEYALSVTAN